MYEQISLKKPYFSKISQIKPGVHCYNVFCKILKVTFGETVLPNGEKIQFATGTIADDSGSADFKLIGNGINNLSTGKVIALRNGRADVVNEHIQLQLDRFGKWTEEKDHKIDIVNEANNISTTAYVKKVSNK